MDATRNLDRAGDAERDDALIAAVRRQVDEMAPGSSLASAPGAAIPNLPRIGALDRYQLLSEIQRGAQGVVYRGIQALTQRPVAIKVVRAGPLLSRGQQARFEREAELLASIRHPNIVALHDCGVASGFTYLVMDLIEGRPVDQFVEAAWSELGPSPSAANVRRVRGRILRLFAGIARGVAAAHRHGVIHRDLKPQNVLVDAGDEPRVLDFGLARVERGAADSAAAGDLTVAGEFVGTLIYASPEQVSADPERLDVRSDVYSLGVMLFQALVRRLPYDVRSSLGAAVQNIRDAQPPVPTALLGPRDDEIDTLVLKCLHKEPDRRYQNAGELADDIERLLAGRPIAAKRDAPGYLLRKFVSRHRVVVSVATALLASVVIGLFASVALWLQAAQQRDRAQRAEAHEAEARAQAEQRADESERVQAFLRRMLERASPTDSPGRDMPLSQLLDLAVVELDAGALRDHPTSEAEIRRTLGETYHHLGRLTAAETQLRAALNGYAASDWGMLRTQQALGSVLTNAGRLDEAQQELSEALAACRERFGEQHPRTASAKGRLAAHLQYASHLEEAEPLFREALAVLRSQGEVGDLEVASTLNNFAMLLMKRGGHREAEPLLVEALERKQRATGDLHPDVGAILNNLATLNMELGRLPEAEAGYRETLALTRRIYTEDHPNIATLTNNLGSVLRMQGKFTEAEPVLREGVALREKVQGSDHPELGVGLNNLGLAILYQRRAAEAEPIFRRAVDICERRLGPTHANTLAVRGNLAEALRIQRRYDESEPLRREVLESHRAVLGPRHTATAGCLFKLAELLHETKRGDEAEAAVREAIDILAAKLPAGHPDLLNARLVLSKILAGLGRCDEAEQAWASVPETNAQLKRSRQEVSKEIARCYETGGDADGAARVRADNP